MYSLTHRTRKRNKMVTPMKTEILVLVFCMCLTVCRGQGQNPNTTAPSQPVTASDGADQVLNRALDKGLDPLYKMTNTFLDLVQPDNALDLLDKLHANYSSADALQKSLNKEFSNDLRGSIETIANFYIGYAAALVIGFLFVIIFPIVGCCVCCCRCCCKKCGGDPKAIYDPRNANCKRITLGIILVTITVLMLGATVSAFMANEVIHEETQLEGDQNPLKSVSKAVISVKNFAKKTVDDIEDQALQLFDDTKTQVFKILDTIAVTTKDTIGKITNAVGLLDKAKILANRATDILDDLETVRMSTQKLSNLTVQLNTSLDIVRANLTAVCSSPMNCLGVTAANIAPDADFTTLLNALGEVDSAIAGVKNSLQLGDKNITQLVQEGFDAYENISTNIKTKIEAETAKSKNETENIKEDLRKEIKTFKNKSLDSTLNTLDNVANATNAEALRNNIKTYGDYSWYVGIVICAILLLIVLFNCLGVMFGFCGERPGYDAPCCNKGVGANLLIASVFFSFCFAWILMFIISILFVLGGLIHTDVCKNIKIGGAGMQLADRILPGTIEGGWKISATETFEQCRINKPLYTAANLGSIFNLTAILDIDNKVQPILNNVKTKISEFNIGNVMIIPQDTKTKLRELGNSNISGIQFSRFTNETTKNLTKVGLNTTADKLDSIGSDLPTTSPPSSSQQLALRNIATELRRIQTAIVDQMEQQRRLLQMTLEKVKTDTNIQSEVKSLIAGLDKAEANINTNGTKDVRKQVNEIIDEVGTIVSDGASKVTNLVENVLGKCRPVYDAYNDLYNTLCVRNLYPFNGLWFSIGWFLFFIIPSVIFCLVLVSLYRKEESHDKHGFDENNFDEYQGQYPGDTIPLDDRTHSSNKRMKDQSMTGSQNPGYEDHRGSAGGAPNQRYGGGQGQGHPNDYSSRGARAGGGGTGGINSQSQHHPSSTAGNYHDPSRGNRF